MSDLRRHPMRVLTRLEGRVPALHALLTRSHARRFDALAPKWDTIRSDVADSRRMLERALDELGVRAPARVLDVGTGTGQAAGILARRFPGAQIDAVDASAQMIELARAKPELSAIRFAVADGGRMPYPDAAFDLAVSLLVQPFEHELHRVLAAGRLGAVLLPDGPGDADLVPDCAGGAAPRARRLRRGALRSDRPGRVDGRSPVELVAARGRAGRVSARLAAVCPWSGTEGDW